METKSLDIILYADRKPAPVACHIGCNMGSELRCLQYILLIFGDNQNIAHDITNYALLAFST